MRTCATDSDENGMPQMREKAGVTRCHRWTFCHTSALWCPRDGMDLHSLRLPMGDTSLPPLHRCLALQGKT